MSKRSREPEQSQREVFLLRLAREGFRVFIKKESRIAGFALPPLIAFIKKESRIAGFALPPLNAFIKKESLIAGFALPPLVAMCTSTI